MRRAGFVLIAILATALARTAIADADETQKLFADGVAALADERPNEAVASFEALADRGVVDAVASYDRGLAYALRVHANAEQPGDLGRAAHGFEEAIALTNDPHLAEDARAAVSAVRSEVSRRKAREGVTVDVEQRASPWSTLAHALAEDTWIAIAIACSFILAAALFVRWLATQTRARAGAAIAIAVSAPVLVLAALLARSARSDRLFFHEAIVVSAMARPSDAHGIVLPQSTPLPEGARVEVLDPNESGRGGFTAFRWGSLRAWVPAATLRPLAKP